MGELELLRRMSEATGGRDVAASHGMDVARTGGGERVEREVGVVLIFYAYLCVRECVLVGSETFGEFWGQRVQEQ